jgi:protocatechuate 3,4-dioxygenase beta subunit
VTTTIENTGGQSGSGTVTLDVPGLGAADASVSLNPGESTQQTLSVSTESGDDGSYTVTASTDDDSASTRVDVTEAAPESGFLSGRVSDQNNNDVSSAMVIAIRTSDGLTETTETTAEGDYTLEVPAGTYDVVVNKTGFSTARSPSNEVDPDRTTTANLVIRRLLVPTTLEATPNDPNASAGEEVEFTVRLLDQDGNPLDNEPVTASIEDSAVSFANSGPPKVTNANGEVTFTVTSSEIVTSDVTFEAENSASVSDTSTVSFIENGEDAIDNDEFEPNDSPDTATDVSVGRFREIPNLEIVQGESDYFAVELDEGDSIGAAIDFSDAEGDLDLALYDPDNSQLDLSQSVSDSETVSVSNVDQSGTYLVEVYGFAGASASYDLTIVTESASEPEPGSISGLVTDQEDRRLVGADVTVRVDNASQTVVARTTVNAQGSYSFSDIQPGEYMIIAEFNSNTGLTTATVESGRTTTANVVVRLEDGDDGDSSDDGDDSDDGDSSDDGDDSDDGDGSDDGDTAIGLAGPSSAGPVSLDETVEITYEYTNPTSREREAGRLEFSTPSGVEAVSVSGDGISGLGGSPQAILYGIGGPISPEDVLTTTVEFRVSENASVGSSGLSATAYIEERGDIGTQTTTLEIRDSVTAQFDTDRDGIEPGEAQEAIVALNNGEITPRDAQEIIVALNS